MVHQNPTNVQTFTNEKFGQLRTHQTEDGKILFCLADVAKALEIANSRNVVQRLSPGGVHTMDGVSITENQYGTKTEQVSQMTFIDEPNLYRCIFQSRKKEAEVFQNWVFEEVLPSIRKTGGYAIKQLSPAEMLLHNAQLLVEQERRVAAMEQKVHVLEAKRQSSPDVFSVVAYASLHGLRCNISTCKEIGKKASAICRKAGIALDTMPDPRFGRVNVYPASVLEEAFTQELCPSAPVF